jgi:hypothetical protein
MDRPLAGIREKELRICRLEPSEQPLEIYVPEAYGPNVLVLVSGLVEIIDIDRGHGYLQ